METKKDIRKKVFALRKECSQETADQISEKICETVISLLEFQEASCIYAYADYNKEVSTKGIIEAAWKAGKRVAVPKVHGKDMTYYLLTSFNQLEPGYFNIPEPAYGEIAKDEDALMIVPGVAFDKNRHRVGYGQGFYDRYLSVHTQHKTVAIAFDFQIVEEAPAEETDIFPQKLVTETAVYQ